jgi:uncharacterized protein (TIGR03437 family)
VQAQVVDDCGNPLTSGVVQASFASGDTTEEMTPVGGGLWAGTWEPHGLAGRPASVAINASSSSGLSGLTSISGKLDPNPTAPVVNPGGIVNAAGLVSTPLVAPGEFISIFGTNLAPSTAQSLLFPYEMSLAGTQVLLGGQPLPLEFVSSGQINAVVPYETPVNGFEDLVVEQNGVSSLIETLVVETANPAVFTQNETGQGAGAIIGIQPDGNEFLVTPAQPASVGDILSIYCSGLGAVSPAVPDGAAAPLSTLSRTVNPVTVTIGGISAQVQFAGLAPGYAGLYQVNAYVPQGVAAGAAAPVILTTAGVSSSPVTVAIQ